MCDRVCPLVHASTGMQEIASRGKDSGRVQSVLLLTDGIANEGIYKTDGILDEMKKRVRGHGEHTTSNSYAKWVY